MKINAKTERGGETISERESGPMKWKTDWQICKDKNKNGSIIKLFSVYLWLNCGL